MKKSKEKIMDNMFEALTWMAVGALIMELFMIFVVYR